MARTRLSSKGQLIIPKPVRDRHGWKVGTEIEVEDRGSAKYEGPPIPIEDFDKGIERHIRDMWRRFERQSR